MTTTILFDFSRVLLHPRDPSYTGSIDQLYERTLHKNFLSYFVLNEALLDFITEHKTTKQLSLFSNAKILFDPYIQKRITGLFTQIFSAKKLGVSKKDPSSYLAIAASLHTAPTDILFIDDTKENLIYAHQAGLQTFHYTSNKSLLHTLHKIM